MHPRTVLTRVVLAVAAALGPGCAAPQLAPPPAAATTLDPAASSVDFELLHNGRPLRGSFTTLDGSFSPPDVPGSGRLHVAAAAASVNTRNGLRDAHLRTNAYFGVGRFPAITFDSHDLTRIAPDHLQARGTLTFLGVARPLTVTLRPVPAPSEDAQPDEPADVALTCTFTIQRSDFGMTAGVANGSIGDAVRLEVQLHWAPPSADEANRSETRE